nr:uncharacterized protein LOC106732625 [Pelodiscus sinensis]|eukprot:XP_014433532.1 uncharacterized protein LOC106732625 [Pelodiscus sinensis]
MREKIGKNSGYKYSPMLTSRWDRRRCCYRSRVKHAHNADSGGSPTHPVAVDNPFAAAPDKGPANIAAAATQLHQCRHNPSEEHRKNLHHLLKKLPQEAQGQIFPDTATDARPGIFNLLPESHKPGNPGRPIISGLHVLTAGLSGYIDSLLRPYATGNRGDTTDFLRKLQSIGGLAEITSLATVDAEALYPNTAHYKLSGTVSPLTSRHSWLLNSGPLLSLSTISDVIPSSRRHCSGYPHGPTVGQHFDS